jgi:hypothetical protein
MCNTRPLLLWLNLILCSVVILADSTLCNSFPSSLLTWRLEIFLFLQAGEFQWVILLLLSFQLAFLCRLTIVQELGHLQGVSSWTWASHACRNAACHETLLLILLAASALIAIGHDYLRACQPTAALNFFFGTVLCLSVAVSFRNSDRFWVAHAGLATLGLFAVFALKEGSVGSNTYEPSHASRWSGGFDSPNTFGLLMGVLFAGTFSAILPTIERNRTAAIGTGKPGFRLALTATGLVILGSLALCGLLSSYSRGAWLGTAAAIVMAGMRFAKGTRRTFSRTLPTYGRWSLPVAPIVLSLAVIAMLHLKSSPNGIIHRICSVSNVNDFSWRNRFSAWEGSLQIIADYFWGVGWNKATRTYIESYQPSNVVEGGAIETNDFLLLGASLGPLTLAAFLMFIWLRYQGDQTDTLLGPQHSWEIGRRACILILFTGMCLDGVLFKPCLSSIFWVLLGLRAKTET